MKTLLEAVNYRSMPKDIPSPMRGIESILGNLSSDAIGELPVAVSKSEWMIVSDGEVERMTRVFSFDDPRMVKDFVTHLIFEQEDMGHHARVIIEGNEVKIETYTHNVNAVTELDQELSRFCDDLYRDVQDFYIVDEEATLL